jgi:membrane-bound lytic murein transglycosylase B
MAAEAKAEGVGKRGIAALMDSSYSKATIGADRNQKSFKYSLDKFLQVRGADTIIAQGRKRKAKNAEFYASLNRAYGVPAGVIIAIHGMETAFGGFMGDTNVVSAIATLTYDCRRSDFFRPHLIGALKLVDRARSRWPPSAPSMASLGHTQFLPGNALTYGVDGNGDGTVDFYNMTDALASTANFLRTEGLEARQGLSGRRAELRGHQGSGTPPRSISRPSRSWAPRSTARGVTLHTANGHVTGLCGRYRFDGPRKTRDRSHTCCAALPPSFF